MDTDKSSRWNGDKDRVSRETKGKQNRKNRENTEKIRGGQRDRTEEQQSQINLAAPLSYLAI